MTAVPAEDLALTPFLGDIKARLTRTFRRALALPDHLRLSWHHAGEPASLDHLGRFRLEIRTEVGRQFSLFADDAVPGKRGQWQLADVVFTVDGGPSGNNLPKEPDVVEALQHLARHFAGEAPADALAAAQQLPRTARLRREFWDQSDTALFRRVERTTSGLVGMLRLGFRCNQDCFFCPQSRTWQGPDEELTRTWLDEFGQGGIRVLTISGGEPTTYRNFPELVDRAVHHWGMAVFVQTNAIQFAKPRFVERMREAGLHGLFVSFHHHDPVVSDEITRAPKTWARTVMGVEKALEAGFAVALNCCVESHNYEVLPDHARFIVERFVEPFPGNPLVSVDYSQPGAYWDRSLMEGSIVPYDQVTPYLAPALRILVDAGVAVNATGTCGFVPCMFRNDPSLIPWRKRGKFDDQDLDNRQFLEPCRSCAAQPYCVGVRGDVVKHFGDRGLVPYEELPDVEEYRDFDLFKLGREIVEGRR